MMNEKVEEPLSPMARVYQLPITDCYIISMIGFKAKIELELILDDLRHNVSKHPRFCSKLSDDGARWMKIKVSVEDHVYAPTIDPEEIKENGELFVNEYISGLTMTPLDKSRPLWDIHILNVKTSDAEAVGVMRCHHSLGDGMSLMSLLVACTRKTSDPKAFPSIPTIKRRERFLPLHRRNKGFFLRSIFTAYSGVRLIWNTIVDVVQFSAGVLFLKDTETPLKVTGGLVENKPKTFHHRTVSLDDVKLIKNAMNMTINDVLFGVTQTAISRYLNQRNGMEGGTSSELNNLPGRTRIRAGVPVNLRQEIGIKVAGGFIKRSMIHTTTTFSNIIGPVEEVSLHGNQITYIALSCYGNIYLPQALIIDFISYAGKIIISIAVDPTVIPDPHIIFDEMENALKDIKGSLSGKSDPFLGSHH